MNIYLLGYRGSGKSTVGPMVAARLGWMAVDLDADIERRSGRSIAALFREQGEAAFRRLESIVLAEWASESNHVIALGGGAVLAPANRECLRTSGRGVWLQAAPKTLWERIAKETGPGGKRPNLTAAGGEQEVIELLRQRAPLYEECADCTIPTEGRTPEQVAEQIVNWWREVDKREG